MTIQWSRRRKLLLWVLMAVGWLSLLKIIFLISHTHYPAFLRQSPSSPPHFPSSLPRGHSNPRPSFHSLDGAMTEGSKSSNLTLLDNARDVSSKGRDVKSTPRVVLNATSALRICPKDPPNLVGLQEAKEVDKPLKALEKEWHGVLTEGGRYTPPDCLPENRTAIIIPCRNRWPHLRVLLNNLIPVLIRQQVAFTLFVMESDQASHFNKGILLNAGYLEALKYGNYTCFVFHDVDLLPLNDRNLYRCGLQPRHLAVAVDKFKFKLPYPRYFGGVLALTRAQVEKVNGHSNVYFGWGGEDDDIEHRVHAKGYKIFRMPVTMSQYHMIRHGRDKGNEITQQKMPLVQKQEVIKRMDEEGLRQVQYEKDWVQLGPLFTWIHVTVNETRVIQNLPPYVRTMFKNGLTF